MANHRQIDHTADLALELRASSEPELLAEGARAIVSLLTEGAPVEGTDPRRLELAAIDREDRLVQWLNEILLLAMVDVVCGAGLARRVVRLKPLAVIKG